MKLINICAVIALSGLFTMASQAAFESATAAINRCEAVHTKCTNDGRSAEECRDERHRCLTEAYDANPDAVLRNRMLFFNAPH